MNPTLVTPSSQRRLPPSQAEALAPFPRREFGKGAVLYRAGDPADTVFRLEQGLVKLAIDVFTGRERIIAVAGPGDLIGALAPGSDVLREGAEALSVSVMASVVPRDQAERLEGDLFRAAGDQLLRLTDALEDAELPVPARLARTLLRLGDRFGHVGEDGRVRLTLPITHDNFAAMVGAARETTTGVLGDMRHRGVLLGTRGRYQYQRDALQDFAVASAFN